MGHFWRHSILIIVACLLYGCGGAECSTDADCDEGKSCVTPGSILFGGRICAGPPGQFGPGPTTPDSSDNGDTDAGCVGPSCQCSESVQSLCERTATACGELSVIDQCGVDRIVDCGPCGPVDTDNDGTDDAADNCPETSNPDQSDVDGDGVGDSCDNCPMTANTDQANDDTDLLGNVCDNCISRDNNDQADSNADGIPDACTLSLINNTEISSGNTGTLTINSATAGDDLLYLVIAAWDDTSGRRVQSVTGAGLVWDDFTFATSRGGELNISVHFGIGDSDGSPVNINFDASTRTPIAQLFVFEGAEFVNPFAALNEDSENGIVSASISVTSDAPGDFAVLAMAFDNTDEYELDPGAVIRTDADNGRIRLAMLVRPAGDPGNERKISGDFNKGMFGSGDADWLGVGFLLRHAK